MGSYRNRITVTQVAPTEYQLGNNTMENIEIELPMMLLDAATICAAKSDVRFYLNGVAIDQGHIVSTDGHRAFACDLQVVSKELPQIILPTESVKAFLKKIPAKNRKAVCNLSFDPKTKQGKLSYHNLQAHELFIGIDGKFPDWKRIFPKNVPTEFQGVYPQFNWSYMQDFQKVHKALGGNGLQVLLYPRSASESALVHFDSTQFNHAVACIMPMRA